MNKSVCILFVLFLFVAGSCRAQSEIVKIQFTTMTRGYQKQIFIASDSITRTEDGRHAKDQISKSKISEGEWTELVTSLKDVQLKDVPALPSPSSKRAFDGARFSSLKIITKSGDEFEHAFDNEDPHEKLRPLMDLIMKIDNRQH